MPWFSFFEFWVLSHFFHSPLSHSSKGSLVPPHFLPWWCPCVESSLVLLEEDVCYYQCVLLAELYYPLPSFILYSKAKFACYSRCFWTSYSFIPVPYNEKDIFPGAVLELRVMAAWCWSGWEEIPHVQGQERCLHFAGAAEKRYPTSKVRSGGCASLDWPCRDTRRPRSEKPQ